MDEEVKLVKEDKGKPKRSLEVLISISFIVLMLTTIGVITYIIFSNWKVSANNTIRKLKNDADKDIIKEIETLVSIPLNNNELNYNLIRNGILDIYNKKECEAFFAGVIKSSNEEIYSFSYGTEKGEYYGARRNEVNEIEVYRSDTETEGNSLYYAINEDLIAGEFIKDYGKFDPRTRDWYMIAKEKGMPVFSPIYKHFIKDDLVISAAYPIYTKEGILKGVLGTHIILSRLNSYLKDTIQDKNAIAYIIERKSGELVANSLEKPNFETFTNGNISRTSIRAIENKSIIEAYENYIKTSDTAFVINKGKENFHIKLTEYKKEGLDWLLITAIPESQLTDVINKNIIASILLSIFALLLSIIIHMKSTGFILKPIKNLIITTEKFSQGDLLQRAKIFRNDEIGKLAKAFNNMAEELFTLINNLEDKVSERTSELEYANNTLMKSEENIRLLLDSTAEGIFGLDMNGNCTFLNPSCLRMLGYKHQEELIGKNMHSRIHHKGFDGSPIPLDECKISMALSKGERTHVDDEVFWRVDGTCFPVEYYSYPQYRDKKIVGAVVTFMDITERKLVQDEIFKEKERAEAANIAKSQFLANMSHEIRTPMNGVIGFLQLLEYTELTSEQSGFIKMMKISADTLLTVINDILDISKIEAGKMELEYIPFDIRSTIETIVASFDAKAKEKSVELNVLISSLIPHFVIGDPTKLRQVIGNLLSNALKFTSKGEVFIEVALSNFKDRTIEITFTIQDTGIGMSEQEINRIFKPFSQADSSSTRKYGGTGLGLAISKRIVEMMGGEISVISEKGKGATFRFTLTLTKADDSIIPLLPNYSILKGKRILIVDDHAMNRYIARVYLEEVGCMVTEAESSVDAINKLQRSKGEGVYNVILVDYQMQEMDGFDFSDSIKRISIAKQIPLILMTSVVTNAEAQHAKTKGFAGYISKPYRRSELLDCTAMILDGSKPVEGEDNVFITKHSAQEAKYNRKLKILLVEDNDSNIKFFIKLLKMKGFSCDVAVNGLEAVMACEYKDYDIIFMDCQMPVMDGYEATRHIRAAEDDKRHIMIVAMTAHVMKGDAEKCLDAGMDDYLSKPINSEQVLSLIQKYGVTSQSENIQISGYNYFTETVHTLMDESGFDKKFCEGLLSDFCQQAERLLMEIKEFSSNNNFIEAANLLHQLKGSAGSVRAKDIAKFSMKAEEAARTANIEMLDSLLLKLDNSIGALCKATSEG